MLALVSITMTEFVPPIGQLGVVGWSVLLRSKQGCQVVDGTK